MGTNLPLIMYPFDCEADWASPHRSSALPRDVHLAPRHNKRALRPERSRAGARRGSLVKLMKPNRGNAKRDARGNTEWMGPESRRAPLLAVPRQATLRPAPPHGLVAARHASPALRLLPGLPAARQGYPPQTRQQQ